MPTGVLQRALSWMRLPSILLKEPTTQSWLFKVSCEVVFGRPKCGINQLFVVSPPKHLYIHNCLLFQLLINLVHLRLSHEWCLLESTNVRWTWKWWSNHGSSSCRAEQLCGNHEVISPVLDVSSLHVSVLLSETFNSNLKHFFIVCVTGNVQTERFCILKG